MGSRILAKTTHTETWWAAAPPTVLRCTANYLTTGTRCRSVAAAGTTVCDKHGARLPTVQAAAAQRIGESARDMVDLLLKWVNDPEVDMKERVRIAQDMLDRSGHGATSKHLHGVVTGGDPLDQLFMDLLSTPGMLADLNAPVPPKQPPSQWDLEVLADAEWREPRTIQGEIVPRDDVTEPPTEPTIPKHIRDALRELL